MSELKPCPFCGKYPQTVVDDATEEKFGVKCFNCGGMIDAEKDTLQEAIEAWNKRVPSAQPQLEICPIYGGMCGYPSNLCYECPRHEGAKERPQWWTEGLQPFAQPQWIPVTERLPDEWKRVLIQNDEGLFLVGFVKDRGWGKEWYYQYEMYDYDAYEEFEQGKIVAWCELPDRWRGEQG